MSDIFKNYPQPDYYIPDNRRIYLPKDIITIMSGETTTHSFEVPLNLNTDTKDYKAIYHLGLKVVLEKPKSECDVIYDEETKTSIMTWILTPSETMLFKDTLLDAQVQLKFTLNDDTILYSDIRPIVLEDSLDRGDM